MSAVERVAIEISMIALVILGFALWERHKGAVSCERADAAAVAKQEAHNAALKLNQDQTIAHERQAYEDALLQPVSAPLVRLCIAPRTVSQNPPTALGTHAKAPSAGVHAPDFIEGPDIGKPLLTVAHNADAQIIGLQSYIREICK